MGEAAGVQVLLDWVLSITVHEHAPDADVADDETLLKTVGHLAERSHKALGAGVGRAEAVMQAARLVGMYR